MEIKKIIIVSFILLLIADNVSSGEIQITQQLLNAKTLENLDLYDAVSIESVTSNWEKSKLEDSWKDKKELRAAKVNISSQIFSGSLRKYTDDSFEIAYTKYPFDFNLIDEIMIVARKTWGEPYCIVDSTEAPAATPGLKIVNYNAQWVFNKTIVDFKVLGTDYKEGSKNICAFFLLNHKDKCKLLENTICLRCETKQIITVNSEDSEVTDEMDFVFLIDLNKNIIMRSNKSVFANITSITDSLIVASYDDKKEGLMYTLRIDRVLGSYNLQMISTSIPGASIRRWGNCRKIEMKELKPQF